MSENAPFRELLVELPRALFESLQAIGEGAVEKARAQDVRRPRQPRLDRSLFDHGHIRLVMARYGWRDVELLRDARNDAFMLAAMARCGQRQRLHIDAMAIARCCGPRAEIELLDRIVDITPRSCYCVQRQETT